MIILTENTRGPYNKRMFFFVKMHWIFLSELWRWNPSPTHRASIFFLESDQCRHEKQSDVIVLVIGEEVCVAL